MLQSLIDDHVCEPNEHITVCQRLDSRIPVNLRASCQVAPVAITQNVAWMKRQFNACQTPRSMYLSIFNSFRVTMLKSIRKSRSKNRYFYHIFVSPGNAPGAITLNVVWMERKFDAYKLSRCMCPSNYNRFWDRARYWSKIVIFSYPLALDAPLGELPSEYRHPVWHGKTRMAWLPDG